MAGTVRDEQSARRLSAVRELHRKARHWLAIPNVVGVEMGRKIVAGSASGSADGADAVIFFVARKLADPLHVLAAGSYMLPTEVELAGRLYPTDVIEERWVLDDGIADALEPLRIRRQDPVVPGLSVGNSRRLAGTIGAIVRQQSSGRVAMLGNWHVLVHPETDHIVQPGPADGGANAPVGRVLKSILGPIGDAAIAGISGRQATARIFGLDVMVERFGQAKVGKIVVKSGRSTGITRGRVKTEMRTSQIDDPAYPAPIDMQVFVIEPIDAFPLDAGILTADGDSGAAWMLCKDDGTPTGTMLGLHVAATSAGNALACHAMPIAAALGISPLESAELMDGDPDDDSEGERIAGAMPANAGFAASARTGEPHRVTARNGLTLRALADKGSAGIGGRAWNSLVHVLSRKDGWGLMDLEGDGKSDGFMSLDFLRAGAEPLPELPVLNQTTAPGLAIDRVTPGIVQQMFPSLPAVRAAIGLNLPHVLAGLRSFGLTDRDMVLMALATIRAETESFRPVSEGVSTLNTGSVPFDAYEKPQQKAIDLGNTRAGDGARFKGRGFVQLTGRFNYASIGPMVGAALEADPELANDAAIAARVLAAFLKRAEARIRPALAENTKAGLRLARRAVNGGDHGFDRFADAWLKGRAALV